jgi:hypothetical protein
MFRAGWHDGEMTGSTPATPEDGEASFAEPVGTNLARASQGEGWEVLETPAQPWPLLPQRPVAPVAPSSPAEGTAARPARSRAGQAPGSVPGRGWGSPDREMAALVAGMCAVVRDEVSRTKDPAPDELGAASLLMVVSVAVFALVGVIFAVAIGTRTWGWVAITGAIELAQIGLFWAGLRRYRRDLG